MVQELIALTIFGSALVYGIFQLGRFLIPSKKKHSHNCGSDECNCK